MEQKQRSLKIDALRCMMNLFIVFHHAGFPWMWGYASNFDNKVAEWLSKISWSLPTLFCLSGYLMFKGFSRETCKGKVWNRVKRLAVPLYLVNWAIVLFVLAGQFLGHNFGDKYDFSWYVKRVLCISEGTGFPPLWYVRTLLIYMLPAPIIFLVLRKKLGAFLLLGVSIAWCLLSTYFGFDRKLWMVAPSYSMVAYIFGGILAVNGKDICNFAYKYWPAGLALYLGGLISTIFVVKYQYNGILCAMQCIFWFSLAPLFERFMKFKTFKFLGSCAFFIYVVHVNMQWAGSGRILGFAFKSLPPGVLGYPGAFLASLFLFFAFNLLSCSALWVILCRLCPWLARTLNGRL